MKLLQFNLVYFESKPSIYSVPQFSILNGSSEKFFSFLLFYYCRAKDSNFTV